MSENQNSCRRENEKADPPAAGDAAYSREKGKKTDVFSPLRSIRVMSGSGILAAAAIVLGFFKIPLTQLIEIRFAVLPLAIAAYLYGPAAGGTVGLISDIGGYLLKPTGPFFPGFTVTSVVSGVIFGCMLHRKKLTVLRILAAEILYTAVCGICLNSLWLSLLYGNAFIAVLTARLLKELVMIPVNTVMLALILEPVKRLQLQENGRSWA